MKPLATRLIYVAAFCASLALGACEEKISQDNYALIQNGMELSEVEKILGKGEVLDQGGTSIGSGGVMSGSSNNSQRTYEWKVPGKEITVTFNAEGKVITKNARGL